MSGVLSGHWTGAAEKVPRPFTIHLGTSTIGLEMLCGIGSESGESSVQGMAPSSMRILGLEVSRLKIARVADSMNGVGFRFLVMVYLLFIWDPGVQA